MSQLPGSAPTTRWLHGHFTSADEALHACVRDRHLQRLRQLLGASPAPNVNYSHPLVGPPVHFAALCGDLDAVELLLAAGADPLLVSDGDDPLTAIGFAALEGHRDVIRRLWMSCPPEGHVQGLKPYQTCLVVAARRGHAAAVEDLLGWWDGWPLELKAEALLWAARRWHLGVATLLLGRASFEQSTIQEALHAAARRRFLLADEFKVKYEGIDYLDQQQLIALLIDAGADPNSCPDKTPLVCSAAYDANLTGALKMLLEKGADPNKTNGLGKSALRVLATAVGVGFPPHRIQNETAIRLLLQHNASVTRPDNAGECPLHWAAYGLDLRLFRLYLSSPSDLGHDALLRLTNKNGETLLHYAAAGCRVEVMEFLLARGLDVNAKNSNGWTPLMCALVPVCSDSFTAANSPAEAMRAAQCLLSHGADASIVTEEGWTPLHGLALHCDDDVMGRAADLAKDLISRGVDPEARAPLLSPGAREAVPSLSLPWGYRLRDAMANPATQKTIVRPGLTPLYWAAERGAVGVVRALLAHGVDVSSTGVDGISPTRMAAESKFLKKRPELVDDLIGLLLAAGAGF
ncbi:ankyrin repeat [Trichoderma cornu-damae]|uniref:Ankyrin repeat n=1 Tax=Trichoderma cornu-damae TaxID=654480 RepID=A0A9P8QT58_9HYPO|nr:ankyrin repeat [Trichoderma cornu-damae]